MNGFLIVFFILGVVLKLFDAPHWVVYPLIFVPLFIFVEEAVRKKIKEIIDEIVERVAEEVSKKICFRDKSSDFGQD